MDPDFLWVYRTDVYNDSIFLTNPGNIHDFVFEYHTFYDTEIISIALPVYSNSNTLSRVSSIFSFDKLLWMIYRIQILWSDHMYSMIIYYIWWPYYKIQIPFLVFTNEKVAHCFIK